MSANWHSVMGYTPGSTIQAAIELNQLFVRESNDAARMQNFQQKSEDGHYKIQVNPNSPFSPIHCFLKIYVIIYLFIYF